MKKIEAYIVIIKKEYMRKGNEFWNHKEAQEVYRTYKMAKQRCGSLCKIAKIEINNYEI